MRSLAEFCSLLFDMDPGVRFAGVIRGGRLVAGGMRPGLFPLEPAGQEEQLYRDLLRMEDGFSGWEVHFGRLNWFVIRHEFVTLLAFKVDGQLLLVSLEPRLEFEQIYGLLLQANALIREHANLFYATVIAAI